MAKTHKKSVVIKKDPKVLLNKNIFATLIVLLASLFIFKAYKTKIEPDTYCTRSHPTTTQMPKKVETPEEYFSMGDYEFEKGNCKEAIVNYTKSLFLNKDSAEVYNNRGYVYMRLKNYPKALTDLNKAIELRPSYAHALMNRGDIYNYYYGVNRQKALEDYNKIISLGGAKEGSLCGHRLLAKYNGWKLQTFWTLLTKGVKAGCD